MKIDKQTRESKFCSRCKSLLPIVNFNKNRSSLDGRQGYCKYCLKSLRVRNRSKLKAYKLINVDHIRITRKRYYQECQKNKPEYQEISKKKASEYYYSNKEKISMKKKSESYRTKAKAQREAYKKKYPHKCWARISLANHRKNGYTINITKKELESLAIKTEQCPLCGEAILWGDKPKVVPNSPSLDRINNGSVISLETVQIVCYQCNTTKGSRTMKDFIFYCETVAGRFRKHPGL